MWEHVRLAALIALMSLMSSACATTASRPLAPAAFAGADSVTSTFIAPGVTHTFIRDARGPWAIHVLEVDARICEPVLQTRKPAGALSGRATTSALTADALAGINGDFFMLPGGTPVGAHVTGGVPLIGPTDRPVFATSRNGWHIGVAHINGYARVRHDSVAITQVNRAAQATSAYRGTHAGLTLFTAPAGDSVPADPTARVVMLRLIGGNERAGRGVVMAEDSAAAAVQMRPGTAVLFAHGADRDWARRRTAGDTVTWTARVTIGAVLSEAVGGFPELLRDGRDVLGDQIIAASFGEARHPRTALGWTPGQRLLLVVVDGRQPEWSAGMSLNELVWLFRSLGATDALNLDGGGSTAMVIDGRTISRPSDREGERPVGNALALTGCR